MASKFLIFFLLAFTTCMAQENTRAFIGKLYNRDLGSYENVTEKYSEADLSSVFARETPALGIIGGHERLSMIILTAKPTGNKGEYAVTGKSRVKNNINSFTGTITISKIYLLSNKGYITGTYIFHEDSTLSHPGIFTGNFASKVIIDNNSSLAYNPQEGQKKLNNAFVGKWKAYKGNLEMKANWGDNRVPDSGDLDVGEDMFIVNDRYIKAGWKGYHKAYVRNDAEAIIKEKEKWW